MGNHARDASPLGGEWLPVADFKQPSRIRDGALLKELHHEWRECALCLSVGWEYGTKVWIGLSLHHVLNKPRDDVRSNLVMLCGDGVRGCHGRVTHNDPKTLSLLRYHIHLQRPDIIEHLEWRLGSAEAAREWLSQLHS